MKKIFLTAALTALSYTGMGQSWYKTADLPEGAAVTDLATDGHGTVYALTSYLSDIFYTTDHGANWTALPGTYDFWNATDIEVDKATGTLYVGTLYSGLFWTSNKGISWSNQPFYTSPTSGFHAYINKVIRKPGTNIIVANEPGIGGSVVYRSTNAGASWTNHAAVFGGVYAFGYLTDGTLLAGTENGVFRSADNGVSWIMSNTGMAGKQVVGIVQHGADNKIFAAVKFNYSTNDTSGCGMYVSADNGMSWVRQGEGIADGRLSSIAIDSATAYMYASYYGGIYRSMDTGLTWVALTAGLNAKDVTSVISDSLWAFSGNMQSGVAFAALAGSLWHYCNTGITVATANTFVLATDGTVHLQDGGYTGMYRRSGSTWIHQLNGLPVATGRQVTRARDGTLYAAFIHDTTGLFKSVDNGNTWTGINHLPLYTGAYFINYDALETDTAGNLYALTSYSGASVQQVLFKSADGGATWDSLLSVSGTGPMLQITGLHTARNGNVYFTSFDMTLDGNVWISTDGGATFSVLPSDLAIDGTDATLCIAPDDSLYLVQYNHIYKFNGAGHWSLLPEAGWPSDFSFNPITLAVDNAGALFVTCRNNGVYYSATDGAAWSNISAGLPVYSPPFSVPVTLNIHAIQFDGANTPYAIAKDNYAGSLNGIYKFGMPPASVNNVTRQLNVVAYPNPASANIHVSILAERAGTAQLEWYDAEGKKVMADAAEQMKLGFNKMSFDIQQLPPGVYFLKVVLNNAVNIIRVMKN